MVERLSDRTRAIAKPQLACPTCGACGCGSWARRDGRRARRAGRGLRRLCRERRPGLVGYLFPFPQNNQAPLRAPKPFRKSVSIYFACAGVVAAREKATARQHHADAYRRDRDPGEARGNSPKQRHREQRAEHRCERAEYCARAAPSRRNRTRRKRTGQRSRRARPAPGLALPLRQPAPRPARTVQREIDRREQRERVGVHDRARACQGLKPERRNVTV